MNAVDTVKPKTPSQYISQVAFSMFVYVADSEKDITAQEIRRFQTLLKETSWIGGPDLLEAIYDLREKYSMLWTAYDKGDLTVTAGAIRATLAKTSLLLGEERDSKLRKDLGRFLDRLEGGIFGMKLPQGDQKTKTQARKELRDIIGHASSSLQTQIAGPPVTKTEIMKRVSVEASVSEVKSTTSMPARGVWQSGKTRVRCVSVVQETHDTKTYNFAAEPQVLFHFKPGQFVTIEIALPHQVLRRSYTISSSPSRPYLLSITVKKVPMGWMSNWLYDNMVEGVECVISGPAGKFTCADHMAPRMLFLAAGSGITPCMSMLRWLADTPSTTDVVLINVVRTPADIIFHQELLFLSTRFGVRMRLVILPGTLSAGLPWQGPVGPLSSEAIHSFAPDFLKREVFTCGPPGFMDFAKKLLQGMDFPLEHYHQESFGPAGPAAQPAIHADATSLEARLPVPSVGHFPSAVKALDTLAEPALQIKAGARTASETKSIIVEPKTAAQPDETKTPSMISIKSSGESFPTEQAQSILEAAEANGVMLAHSCRSGVCGACKMRKVGGVVVMEDGHCLSSDEVASGMVLTCIGKPRGAVILASA